MKISKTSYVKPYLNGFLVRVDKTLFQKVCVFFTYFSCLGVRPFPEIHKTWLINDQIQSVTADSSEKNGIKASESEE